MKLTTMAPAYLPSLNYFWQMAQADVLILTDHFQYVKRSSLSISAPLDTNGLRLRLPIKHSKKALPIWQKSPDDSTLWHKKHLHSLRHLFHHSPFAEYYLPQIEQLLSRAPGNLSEFHFRCISVVKNWLHLPIAIHRSSKAGFKKHNEASLSYWCAKFSCNSYLTQKSVYQNGWVQPGLLEPLGIACRSFAPMPAAHILSSYKDLSILTFLFQFGPEAGYLIRQYLT